MTESEFLERFDQRLAKVDLQLELLRAQDARGKELMDRNNELFLEVKEELRLNRKERAELREELAVAREERAELREERSDLRAFTRDLTRRSERVLRGVRSDLAEIADQSRAQTEAILQVLDRLGPRTS